MAGERSRSRLSAGDSPSSVSRPKALSRAIARSSCSRQGHLCTRLCADESRPIPELTPERGEARAALSRRSVRCGRVSGRPRRRPGRSDGVGDRQPNLPARCRRRSSRVRGRERTLAGNCGPVTTDGIADILERRCVLDGFPRIGAHAFRHLFAHAMLSSGMKETDLLRLAGWRSRQMVARYRGVGRDRTGHSGLPPGLPGVPLLIVPCNQVRRVGARRQA